MHDSKQIDDGASLIDRVYALALERIDDLMGCTEDSPEERELSLWAEIADRIEQAKGREPPRRAETTATEGGGPPPTSEWADAAPPAPAALSL